MDPIRADLQGFRLLQTVLPSSQWTTKTGFSSLLVFMGTGQGTMTSEFLARMQQRETRMHFSSAQACIELFSSMEAGRAALDPAMRIKYENAAIYGQANSWYTTHPSIRVDAVHTRRLSLAEKFEPFFADEIQRSWIAFLGPLADQDPATSDAPRKTWDETLRWIVQSNLPGFGSGLAPLQFANNIVLSGIAECPSPAAMAQWIFANRSYGAFVGLRVLGFNLPANASPATVRAAFCSFYYWLDFHLSPDDKHVLRFNTIFVEQLLCKVGRWKNRMKDMGKIDLVAEAQKIFEGHRWTRGGNLTDHTQFPFPSCQEFPTSVFRNIIEDGQV
ncbi:hypothetical protein DFH09DRAFT_901603 [Mycena vulgaris]|nr:hypothetical protein DFH09DRAFT_925785 [Mycena vulgaris]KAJ6600312.1 hypothetical protein DFH09DRAFT_901603 [Mycena vulgaris]